MGYGDKLVATNSRVQTVHILATTTVDGYVTTLARTACGLTGYRTANPEQTATAARCARCTAATHERAAHWERSAMAGLIEIACGWSDRQVATLPRRERSWALAVRGGGFVPAADREAVEEAFLVAVERFTGTRRVGALGARVRVAAQVVEVREFEGSTVGKNGKPRPALRYVVLAGVGEDEGVRLETTTRSVAAGTLAEGARVTVAAVADSLFYLGRRAEHGLGQRVVNAAFRAAA